MSRVLRRVWLLALFGCASVGSPAGVAPRALSDEAASASRSDEAHELLALLPQGSDRCVVARPARLTAAQRTLAQRISQAEPLAWLPELAVSAYASVEREGRSGPSARASVLVTALPPEQARAVIDAHAPDRVDWSQGARACTDVGCPLRARFIAPQRLWIARGELAPAREPGVEVACRDLAQRNAGAIELSAADETDALALDQSWLPSRTTTEMRATESGLHVQRVDRWPSATEAEAALQEQATASLLLGAPLAGLGEARRERRGDALYIDIDVAWEDLELARDDDARSQAAEREAVTLADVRPDLDAVPRDRDALFGVVGYLIDDARRSAEPARGRDLQAARALLEAALERDADDPRIALVLCEMLVTELRDPEQALRLVSRVAVRRLANARVLACARSAAALISPAALEKRLVDDGVVPRRTAREAARAIAEQVRAGAPYESAERAVIDKAR